MSAAKEYVQLPGRGMRREGNFFITVEVRSSRLWLAADHILLVDSTSATQSLKRFYFRQIQGIQVGKTKRGLGLNIAFALLAALFLWFVTLVDDPIGRGFLAAPAAAFGVLLLINWLRGPTAECVIQTAVQRETLPSLGRLRTARKVIAMLKPLIEQAQGSLTNEAAQNEWRNQLLTGATAVASPGAMLTTGRPVPASQPLANPNYRGSAHVWLFWLLIADGLLNWFAIFQHTFALLVFQMFLLLGLTLVGILALIRQQGAALPSGVTRAAWTALGYFIGCFLVGVVQYVVVVAQKPEVADNQVAMMRHFASLNPLETPWLAITYAVTGTFSLCLGLVGVFAARGIRASTAPASPPPLPARPSTPPPLAAMMPPSADSMPAAPAVPPVPPPPPSHG